MLNKFSLNNEPNDPSNRSWRENVNSSLIKLFLLFIPFSRALTINLGFPLKFSEIFLVLYIIIQFGTGQIPKWRSNRWIMIFSFLFIIMVFASAMINTFYQYPYHLDDYSRFSPLFDTFLKFFYILISFGALFTTSKAFSESEGYIRYFFIGSVASCIYAWYLVIFSALKLPVFILPGSDPNIQVADTSLGPIIRTGTFGEGNFMGFFLVIAFILALHYKRRRLAILFLITSFTTFSTTAITSLLTFFVIYICIRYKKQKVKLFSALTAGLLAVFILIQVSDGFKRTFYNKIFGDEDTVEDVNDIFSKTERLNYSAVAIAMAADNPFLGVGPANYSLHYNHFNTLPGFDRGAKVIPNNIYVEVLSEYGGIAFVIFLILIYLTFKRAYKRSPTILAAGLVASLVYFFAFPTFTMLFIWVFWGIIIARKENEPIPRYIN